MSQAIGDIRIDENGRYVCNVRVSLDDLLNTARSGGEEYAEYDFLHELSGIPDIPYDCNYTVVGIIEGDLIVAYSTGKAPDDE